MEDVQKNLEKIKTAINAAEIKYNRTSGSVVLIAVSKAQSIEKIKTAIACEQIHFGESYLQEALEKIKEINNPNIIWHYIGNIQSRKTKLIAQNFSWVESISNYETAQLLNKHRPDDLSPLNICIQVNTSNEPQKGGVLCEEILPLAKKILELPKLKLRGLMAIPAPSEKFEQQLKSFNELSVEFENLKSQGFDIDTLSMGMSNDFEAAIAAGSTMIRIGTAMFGKRIKIPGPNIPPQIFR